jgi:hypothetical protein
MMCDARGLLETEDKVADLVCTAILHRAGNRDEVLESMGVRSGWEFVYRRKRDMDGPLQITLACPGYHVMTTKMFEWRPKLLGEYARQEETFYRDVCSLSRPRGVQ